MKAELVSAIVIAWNILQGSGRWICWNLFLAFVPLALSVWLFRRKGSGALFLTISWWAGFLVFIAFLPNAPYVLTDVIHLIYNIRIIRSVWMITLILLPVYLVFILAGFQAYVLSLINFGYFLNQRSLSKWVLWMELSAHALSAVGIFLGRFLRFNSWDFITQPDALASSLVDDLASKRPVVIIAVTFAVVACLYWVMKRVSLGIFLQRRHAKAISKQRKTDSSTTDS